MRKQFSTAIEKFGKENSNLIFLTGDLGFMALENVRDTLQDRFINVGVCEQHMISMAAGLAAKGLTSVCYSIAPFLVFRPAEQIRLDVCLHNMNVKLVGNGGGYGYGIMGATHHALEDLAVLGSFQNMKCYIPFSNEDVPQYVEKMLKYHGPAYLRLGWGETPAEIKIPECSPCRKLMSGSEVTIIALGPVVLNAVKAIKANQLSGITDIFAVSEFPLLKLDSVLIDSIKQTGKVLILEEHVCHGGLGENVSRLILKNKLKVSLAHKYATGYPGGTYGSQQYHQCINGLDDKSIFGKILELVNE